MPSPFSSSPLFRIAGAQIRATARQQLRQTVLYRAFDEIQRVGRGPAADRRKIDKVIAKYSRMDLKHALDEIGATQVGRVVRDCEKFARGGAGRMILGALFRALGPTGMILQELVNTVKRGHGLAKELEFATKLLESHGYRVLHPPGAGRQVSSVGTSFADFLDELRASGYGIQEPETKRGRRGGAELPGGVPDVVTEAKPKRFQEIDMGPGGGTRRIPSNHPMLTGDFVRTAKSSSVYEFGYDITNYLLYVRFYAPARNGQKSTSPGSLYQYAGVTPEEFLSLYKGRNRGHFGKDRKASAGPIGGDASPGTWVWEHLRERGTVSGHQKDYKLAGIMGDYVPRKATYRGRDLGEWYRNRTVRLPSGEVFSSFTGPHARAEGPALRGRGPTLSTGEPRRPNPGTPNRGRQ